MAERKDMSYYEDFKHRLETFAKWPKLSKHKPKDLAEAGFVYTGTGDQTLCFSCGGVVTSWEDHDDCWVPHAVKFPHCNFLISSKNLRIESNRLDTFKTWKNTSVTPETLAEAGFYSLHTSDLVRCAFCRIEIGSWTLDNRPWNDHMKNSPQCPLVKEKAKQSKKLQALFSVASAERDVYSNHADAIKPMISCHEDFNSRLKTFDNCPQYLQPKSTSLAEAGFYYKGVGDQVACFRCGGGLAQWKDDDDPWEQHALWFPECNFLKTSKGQGFIHEVRSRAPLKDAVPLEESDSVGKCKICFSKKLEVVLVPCGHLLACTTCSLLLNNKCPVCRESFKTTMRVFPV